MFILLLLLIGAVASQDVLGQTQNHTHRFKVFEYEGETLMYGELDSIAITDRRPTARQLRRGRRRLAKYTKLRWNVHKAYPYAMKVSDVLEEVDSALTGIDDPKARKQYLKSKEKSLFGQYEKDLRKMSRSQGKVLVKLIYRQTGTSAFQLIKETKNPVSAFFWQSIGKIFGINLKSEFDPEEDEMIEQIVADLDQGGYNIYFRRYNYRLN
ncbi:MAG: DUF4294 domain-containing protein [Bacteroidota bacterium]